MENKFRKYAIFFGILFLSLLASEAVAEEIEEPFHVLTDVQGLNQPVCDAERALLLHLDQTCEFEQFEQFGQAADPGKAH